MSNTSYDSELAAKLALTLLPGLGIVSQRALYRAAGSATKVLQQSFEEPLIPSFQRRLCEALTHLPSIQPRITQEIRFAQQHDIRIITCEDADYPQRLGECEDAPLVLFYKGHADLNTTRVLSVVGTRNITEHGKELCLDIIRQLAEYCPGLLIISGLAYGVDIHAHRAALEVGLPTVGVLAHGLDRIYPDIHRSTAQRMLAAGGLLTEYPTHTRPEKSNFVQRNRIVAGMCDACLVIESADKGGALITAHLAQDYNRDIFACPGRITDKYSAGCNKLIAQQIAGLVTSGEDLAAAMLWHMPQGTTPHTPQQRMLFPDLTPEEEEIVQMLSSGETQLNRLVAESKTPVQVLLSRLLSLELKGVIKPLSGGRYKLIQCL